MLGNLTVFFGPDAINAYAMHLRDLGPLLWLIRLVMLTAVVAPHLVHHAGVEGKPGSSSAEVCGFRSDEDDDLRADDAPDRPDSSWLSLSFTWRTSRCFLSIPATPITTPIFMGEQVHDVYRMVIVGFRNPFVSLFYIVALALSGIPPQSRHRQPVSDLGRHGQEDCGSIMRLAGKYWPGSCFVGYVAIPVSILFFGLGQRSCKMTTRRSHPSWSAGKKMDHLQE